uniref:Uncharacterized protein n=1 Tax=Arundo donax TaxID=35708 RepID=A0A0A9C5H1_ARUDO
MMFFSILQCANQLYYVGKLCHHAGILNISCRHIYTICVGNFKIYRQNRIHENCCIYVMM